MPIFQDLKSQRFHHLRSDDHRMTQDDCQLDSSWPDYRVVNTESSGQRNDVFYGRYPRSPSPARLNAHDREELIHHIKAAGTVKWSQYCSSGNRPGHHVLHSHEAAVAREQITENSLSQEFRDDDSELTSPAEIERPRSALHSGDFREGTPELERQQHSTQSSVSDRRTNNEVPFLASSPTTPWFAAPSFPTRTQTAPLQAVEARVPDANRSLAPALGSFSSGYVLKAPTSPLVHQANNTDLDLFRKETEGRPTPFDKANRRRTLPPDTFRDLRVASSDSGTPCPIMWDSLSSNSRFLRRSLASSYSLQLASSLQGHSRRPRRPSISAELFSRPHAPMVGSYEESILRGRMSTCPSKPLDFTAQIGVLGKGKTKSSLKCPPHVTVRFPAVFYSYSTSGNGRSVSDDSPSPYVGMIDLENSLPKDTSCHSRRRRRHQDLVDNCNAHNAEDSMQSKHNDQEAIRLREKRHRRTESPKAPAGGSYRIPQQGQLQVMIKNPNKTAVKLFLIPYDLSDMEPGTKTFIRQRSYSAGPILDMPWSARTSHSNSRPETSPKSYDHPNVKPVLRYLIHLNICCPSRGRYYLYSSIRVVFANRVPDGKEKLRNEIQHPEPRYSPYKSSRESHSLRVSTRLSPDGGERRPSPRPPSRANDDRLPHPFRPIPSIRDDIFGLENLVPAQKSPPELGLYNKLSRGNTGYGGFQAGSIASPEGESLLARKLRGLDVQKPDAF
ncbi:hypothetical protein BDW66DRAFT_130375 [Aspergillus desertorum]